MNFYNRLQHELDELRSKDQYRRLREIQPDGLYANWQGRRMLNLSGNDYLSISARRDLIDEFYERYECDKNAFAPSASASRLLTGNHPAYVALEEDLSKLYNSRAALVFNSGYHANVGILSALAGSGDLILCDKFNHASIIDGMALSQAKFKRYNHLNYDQLEKLLAENRDSHRDVFIVTESVFSMDGDVADLKKLVELKKRYDAVLIVDEAHAVGVFGQRGCGVCETTGTIDDIDLIVGTFGKAFCSAGAYGIMPPVTREFLVNSMRPLIFTTGLPPVVVSWSRFVLEKSEKMSPQREHLAAISQKLRDGLREKNMQTLGDSQIVPLIAGENHRAVELAEKFQSAGMLVFAIRPPTVPPGTARLRFSLSAGLREDDIQNLLEVL